MDRMSVLPWVSTRMEVLVAPRQIVGTPQFRQSITAAYQSQRRNRARHSFRFSLLLCRAGTLENEVALAELVDVDNAVFGTLELLVVILPGRLHDV